MEPGPPALTALILQCCKTEDLGLHIDVLNDLGVLWHLSNRCESCKIE